MAERAAARPGGRDHPGRGAFDQAFGRLVARLHGGSDARVRAQIREWAERASQAVSEGHVCLDLNRAVPADARGALLELLGTSSQVGCDAPGRPLVLSAAGLLYLERYWQYEQDLAQALGARVGLIDGFDEQRAVAALAAHCGAGSGLSLEQAQAAAGLLARRLMVVSGGPGTGKTSTVARALAALYAYHGPHYRVAVTAPTGKAAARLGDALAQAGGLPAPPAAGTLHRLLGLRGPGHRRLDAGRAAALPVDCLIIDEASMLDLSLAAKAAAALAPAAQLVLLGDHQQLSSVEAGAVMASLCTGRRGFTPAYAGLLGRLTGRAAEAGGEQPLEDCIVVLHQSYRFHADGGIGALAARIRAGDVPGAIEVLQRDGTLEWRPEEGEAALVLAAAEAYAPLVEAAASGAPAARLFELAEQFRVLCALRNGPLGVGRLNAAIEQRLGRGRRPAGSVWYPGRMVMVSANDYPTRLFNGDVGIARADRSGQIVVCFRGADGAPREMPAARLPAHEPAFAISIHKSQGSEFDAVLVVLPRGDSPILSRELLYTAISRARHRVAISGSAGVLRSAIERPQVRDSGLAGLLWGPAVAAGS